MNTELNKHAETMAIIVEALLYTSSPSFIHEPREELEYLSVLEELKDSNPEVFDSMSLEKISLFNDKDATESAFISNIKQLLEGKLNVVNADDTD